MVLNNQELESIKGGGFKYGAFAILGALITFVAGIVDGYLRPMKCN